LISFGDAIESVKNYFTLSIYISLKDKNDIIL